MVKSFSKNTSLLITILITISSFTSCVLDSAMENLVATEDVLYISGDVVKLTGRVLETNGSVDDHGFQIDDNENFSAPIIISLGEKENGLGRFIGEYKLLNINTKYYYRSYINVEGEVKTGQTKEFNTLNPSIESFYPPDGLEGNSLIIYGTNFTQDTEVKIGGQVVEIISIEDESTIVAKVPAITDSYSVEVSVVVQDTVMNFSTFFNYHYGRWELETTFFDNQQIYDAMWLKNGDEFVVGLGAPDRFSLNNKIWKLDLTNYTWVELDYPGAEASTTRLPFNARNVWGSGDANFDFASNQLSPFFWVYSNGVFEYKSFLPFLLVGSVGHYLNDELYVFGGQKPDYKTNSLVYKYNEIEDSWAPVSSSPVPIFSEYPSFVYNNEAYFLQSDRVILKFNPLDNTWEVVTQFVDQVRKGGGAVVLDDKVYIGLFDFGRQIWEWDIANNTWKQKSLFTGGVRDVNLACFSHNNKVFFFRAKYDGGAFEQDPRMELWSLDPNQLK
ncbi:MAG: IPT/TIG domain-containing protein [Bacteroidota bacterium]